MPTSKGELYYLDKDGNKQDASLHEEILSQGDDRAAHDALRPFLKNVLGLTDGQINASYGNNTIQKEFDPEQPRDEEGRWAKIERGLQIASGVLGTGIIVGGIGYHLYRELHAAKFHGTQINALAGILKEGIIPQKSTIGGDTFATFSEFAKDRKEKWQKAAKGYSYVTTNLHMAGQYAIEVSKQGKVRPIVLKLNIPKGVFVKKFWSDVHGGDGAYSYKGTIPPEYIEGVFGRKGKYIPIGRLQRLRKIQTVTVYVVLLVKDKQDITKIEDRVLIAKDKLDVLKKETDK